MSEEKPLVYVPKRERKRRQQEESLRRVRGRTTPGDTDEPKTADNAASAAGPAAPPDDEPAARSKISLLDQVTHNLVQAGGAEEEEERRRKRDAEDLLAGFNDFKPLQSVQERAQDIQYVQTVETAWTPPRHIRDMSADEAQAIRQAFRIIVSGDDLPNPVTRFADLKLPRAVLDALASKGIEKPTPIQMQGLPAVLAGRDLIGVAFTGSGKTLVFALPAIMRALEMELRMPLEHGEGPCCIILSPSRELTQQIFEVCSELCEALARDRSLPRVRTVMVMGGVNKREQIRAMSGGCHIIVATPGRLIDLLQQGHVRLEQCRFLCLDEADRLIDMGFEDDLRQVLDFFTAQRQTLLFSATMPDKIAAFARSALTRAVDVNVGRAGAANMDVLQDVLYVKDEAKLVTLLECLQKTPPPVLIFSEKSGDVDAIHEYLTVKGVDSVSVHGGLEQRDRTEAITRFKAGSADVLVATDVASKGLDFADVKHVINYDMPREIENYVHRIGRTGRRGRTGLATTFINRNQSEQVLLDLKYLLIEARQRVPLVLQSISGPRDHLIEEARRKGGDVSDGACQFCGGLGHSITECTKLEQAARSMQHQQRDFLRD